MDTQTNRSKQSVFPAIRYARAASAIDWLEKAFGFRRLAVYAGQAPEEIAHAELLAGEHGDVIMLGSLKGPARDAAARSSDSIYIYVADVDAHYQRAKQAGATIERELTDTDYGSREYSARDLEGRVWSFGTYAPSQ
jgi:uncharacterized glyoxalase superfamily protein PhnB